jgi:hypothetical protein
MSIFLLASAAHSPGVTSLGVAMTVDATSPTLLVDANREPDQAVLAGYLSGADPHGCGLAGLLQAHRERRPLELAITSMLMPLGEQGRFLPGFTHPGMVSLFAPVWPELATALEAEEGTVLVDSGRIGAGGLPPALVSACSGVAVLTRCALPDLAALRLYLPQVVASAGEGRVGLVLVGPGRPYSGAEIRRQFNVPIWGQFAWQPAEAAVYALGNAPGRRHGNSAYLNDVRDLDRTFAERDLSRRELLGAPR